MFTAIVSFLNDLRSVNRWWFCARVSTKQEQTERSVRIKRIMSVLCPIGICLAMAWTYYVFVVVLCVQKYLLSAEPQTTRAICFLVLFHVFFLLWVVSYFRTMFTDPGHVPAEWVRLPPPPQRRGRWLFWGVVVVPALVCDVADGNAEHD